MNLIKHIPNTITCLNLFSGCMSIVAAIGGDLRTAFIWIVGAAVFDFMDGFAARLLKAYSPMGKELDSLSDVVSFGVAPGMILYSLFSQAAVTANPRSIPEFSVLPSESSFAGVTNESIFKSGLTERICGTA